MMSGKSKMPMKSKSNTEGESCADHPRECSCDECGDGNAVLEMMDGLSPDQRARVNRLAGEDDSEDGADREFQPMSKEDR